MQSKTEKKHRREPAQPQYIVNTDGPRGLETIGSGADLGQEMAFADRFAGSTGQKTWVMDQEAGKPVHWIPAARTRAAGGAL